MQDRQRCSRCEGPLEDGFLEDAGEGGMGRLRWIGGPLEKGILGGTKVAFKERRDVVAHRCADCGHLDLFVP